MADPVTEELVERFLRYAAVTSQSDARAAALPSTPGQLRLAELLRDELGALGLDEVHLDANGIVTARLTGRAAGAPAIGFVSHIDTVDVGLSPDVRPQRLRFEGEDICLNRERDIWLREAEHPEIAPYRGEEVLFSDGTGVLGADDKAGVAVIVTLLATLRRTGGAHGDVFVALVPDEEIGLRGAKAVDLARFRPAFAYTVDGGARGEVAYETFNAAGATVTIEGVTAHGGKAKGVMVNPLLIAADLMLAFDPAQTPEQTAGREGYWWSNGLRGGQSEACLEMEIRDFDAGRFAERKRAVERAVEEARARHPRARIACRIEDRYRNIDSVLGADRRCVDLLFRALEELGIPAKVMAMRGGTDGSALSARGLPTPNFFTGLHNNHSRFEFLPLSAFKDSFRVAEALVRLAAGTSPSPVSREKGSLTPRSRPPRARVLSRRGWRGRSARCRRSRPWW